MSTNKALTVATNGDLKLGDIVLGQLEATESGHKAFFPDLSRGGYWPSWLLREIANTIDSSNAEWDRQLAVYFDTHPEREKR